ncbi:hypothetical protein [Streptomyces sp. NPDC046985]|uniref:hypothetical protein n=1 Tax=Streptomyces sp. NPDC046985 TaxID=3155377 RepID=UPI00340A990D
MTRAGGAPETSATATGGNGWTGEDGDRRESGWTGESGDPRGSGGADDRWAAAEAPRAPARR